MDTTPVSLLERLRQPDARDAWPRFVQLYSPLLYYWARKAGLADADASDLVQDVFAVLLQKMPSFEYDKAGSFRSWLRTVTLNKWRQLGRRANLSVTGGEEALAELAGPDPLLAYWDKEYREHVIKQAMRLMQSEFQESTWRACWEHIVGGKSAAEVAAELQLTVGAVRAAKFRVLSRLRQELEGLID